ncbi:Rrf2 family transcriptional regulator [Neorhizobium petrolearium]|uniref:Rrf2 family transcriptional regulator n=1 Tax=Neorhizobium petrolearium TaxID=515361 RepID=A0ABY8M2R6_9HYPH|nr:Rrf2 family transcriptional regulator [Neorhizobium petrolearium]MCC2608584.1 Rrf2 family transcriptional regulator [Neorhizobium petrolearium]WGI68848.1 Rrf2 family transcriptional regulator [Neorhizobium petrolearium]
MRGDSRLSRMLHVLIHLERGGGPMTSEMIGRMLNTNPVVVRRTMAGLRERGYVQSEKGHGGGWTLARSLDKITLLDVYEALDRPELFCLVPSSDHAECLVEIAVNDALDKTRREAEELLLSRFATIRLSQIADDFETKMAALAR